MKKRTKKINSKAFAIGVISVFLSPVLITGCSKSIDENLENTVVKDGTSVNTMDLVSLGEKLYKDTNLSNPPGQSCESCHGVSVGFDDPDSNDPTSLGADSSSIGNRNAPTASYAAHIPETVKVMRTPPGGGAEIEVQIGGQFLDGRAASLEEQAKGPFLNPVEMGNANEAAVIALVKEAAYADEFEALFGADVLDNVEKSYNYIADAIAAFERTEVFSPFNSKFDQVAAGTAVFTDKEQAGQVLFNGTAKCILCHNTDTSTGAKQVFSNFEYRNIGVPANPALSGDDFPDLGQGAVTNIAADNGRFRVSSLRNIEMTAPYMHNGVFTTLQQVVEFYNTGNLALAEVNENIAPEASIGQLNLNPEEVDSLVVFLKTLTDMPMSPGMSGMQASGMHGMH